MATLMIDSLQMVEVHFSFSNPLLVPASVTKWMEEQPETAANLHERKHEYVKGEIAIAPTELCDATGLMKEIEAAGFVLYDARHQLRIHPKQANVRYQTVRFLFSRKLFGENSIFAIHRVQIRKDLQELLNGAMWRLRAFRNPFFADGQVVADKYAASINLEARTPYGNRRRDPGSDESVLIQPAHLVGVENGCLTLV